MMRRRSLALPILGIALVTGCATGDTGDYPDLAPRAVEGRLETIPPMTRELPPPPPPAAALSERIAQLTAQANAADAAFAANLPGVRAAVSRARGAAVSSEAWVAAQMAMSALAADGAPATDALADIDALIVAREDEARREGMSELVAAQATAERIVAEQRSVLQELLAEMNPA